MIPFRFLCLLLVVGMVGCAGRTAPTDSASPTELPISQPELPVSTSSNYQGFEEAVLTKIAEIEANLGARIGFAYHDRDLDIAVSHHGDVLFHPASTMKVPVMIEAYRQADAGEFRMDDTLVVTTEFASMIDGSPFTTGTNRFLRDKVGEPVSIYELTREMIQSSDNVATNMLIEHLGARRITASMRGLGARRSYIIRALMDNEAFEAGMSNRMTPNELNVLNAAIDQDLAATPESCEAMRQIMIGQYHRNMIPALLPEEAVVGNKTGSITRHRHDTGFVRAPFATYYITILIDGLSDSGAGVSAAAELSRFVYDERAKLAGVTP